jgi:hypothetical protein
MKQVTIIREAKKVVVVETKVTTLTLEAENKGKQVWLASDKDGKLYSNFPSEMESDLEKDANGCNSWPAFVAANGYLRLMREKGCETV